MPLQLRQLDERRRDLRAAFAAEGSRRSYQRGVFVYIRGDASEAAYLLETGRIESIGSTEGGRDVSHTIHAPGEPFGFGELILERPRTHSARVLEDALVLRLDRQRLFALLDRRPDLVMALLASALDTFIRHEEVLSSSSGGSARRRVAAVLKHVSTPVSGPPEDRRELRLSHEEIGRLCDLSRQTVTEILDRMRAVGVVSLRPRRVVIESQEGLEGLLGD